MKNSWDRVWAFQCAEKVNILTISSRRGRPTARGSEGEAAVRIDDLPNIHAGLLADAILDRFPEQRPLPKTNP
jgi:hypothetical protein